MVPLCCGVLAMLDSVPFSPLAPGHPALVGSVGPSSNTGLKSHLTVPIIDFCTVVLDKSKAVGFFRKMHPAEIFRTVFGTKIAVGPLMDRPFNFYERSANLVDETGSMCGKLGIADDGRVQISLSGQGCQHVLDWSRVADLIDELDGRLSRVDIAVDDLHGLSFDVSSFKDLHADGAFVCNGRPPSARFVDDLGTGKGCTLYIGQKGHKELCVYDKGKQLGDPDSTHTRAEVRLYGKRMVLTTDALRDPGKYFGGAYPLLAAFVIGEATRMMLKERMVNASGKAMVRFLYTQAGTALRLVMDALGDDAVAYILENVVRPGRPGRFKNYVGDLESYLRTELIPEPATN